MTRMLNKLGSFLRRYGTNFVSGSFAPTAKVELGAIVLHRDGEYLEPYHVRSFDGTIYQVNERGTVTPKPDNRRRVRRRIRKLLRAYGVLS